jgi:hypothetical protein
MRQDNGDARAVLDAQTSERDLQNAVTRLAELHGWAWFHVHDSRRSNAGWPDLVLIRPPRLVIRELKREGERPTAEQEWWLAALRTCGVDVGVWRPSMWGEIERILEGDG